MKSIAVKMCDTEDVATGLRHIADQIDEGFTRGEGIYVWATFNFAVDFTKHEGDELPQVLCHPDGKPVAFHSDDKDPEKIAADLQAAKYVWMDGFDTKGIY
jgi:hypothetical protein